MGQSTMEGLSPRFVQKSSSGPYPRLASTSSNWISPTKKPLSKRLPKTTVSFQFVLVVCETYFLTNCKVDLVVHTAGVSDANTASNLLRALGDEKKEKGGDKFFIQVCATDIPSVGREENLFR